MATEVGKQTAHKSGNDRAQTPALTSLFAFRYDTSRATLAHDISVITLALSSNTNDDDTKWCTYHYTGVSSGTPTHETRQKLVDLSLLHARLDRALERAVAYVPSIVYRDR